MSVEEVLNQVLREIRDLLDEIPMRINDPLHHYLEGKREVAEWVLQLLKEGR